MRVRVREVPPGQGVNGYIIGVDFLVVEMSIHPGKVYVRVEDPVERRPYLLDFAFVDIVDTTKPCRWVIRSCPDGVYLTPEAWTGDDFWDAFYDYVPWAEELYEREAAIMRGELDVHFFKYGAGVGASCLCDYIRKAFDFLLLDKDDCTIEEILRNGDIVRYNATTEEFGVLGVTGVILTYFKASAGIHGYETNYEYFCAQK